jgi:hypothetical protein
MTPVQPNFETDDLGDCDITSPFRGIFMAASNRLFRTDIDELRAQADNILTSRRKTYWYPATIRTVVNSDNAAALS